MTAGWCTMTSRLGFFCLEEGLGLRDDDIVLVSLEPMVVLVGCESAGWHRLSTSRRVPWEGGGGLYGPIVGNWRR